MGALRAVTLVVVGILVVVSIAIRRERRARPKPTVSASVDTLRAAGLVSIPFTLSRQANVELVVSDVAGKTVRSLVSEARPPGTHVATWDGRDDSGNPQAPGFHFARLKVDGKHISTQRIVVAP